MNDKMDANMQAFRSDMREQRGETRRVGHCLQAGRWVLRAGACVKLYVACAVFSVRRAHGTGYGRAEHMCSRGEPLGVRGLLWMRRVTSWLHVWSESGRRVNPCRMVPSTRDEVREARAAAMTSRARSKVHGCELPRRCARCELPRWNCAIKKFKK